MNATTTQSDASDMLATLPSPPTSVPGTKAGSSPSLPDLDALDLDDGRLPTSAEAAERERLWQNLELDSGSECSSSAADNTPGSDGDIASDGDQPGRGSPAPSATRRSRDTTSVHDPVLNGEFEPYVLHLPWHETARAFAEADPEGSIAATSGTEPATLAKLKEHVTLLEKTVAFLEQDIKARDSEISKATADAERLKRRLWDAEARNAELTGRSASLEKELRSTEFDLRDCRWEHQYDLRRIESLEAEKSKLRTDCEWLKDQDRVLRKVAEGTVSRFRNLQHTLQSETDLRHVIESELAELRRRHRELVFSVSDEVDQLCARERGRRDAKRPFPMAGDYVPDRPMGWGARERGEASSPAPTEVPWGVWNEHKA